MGSDAPIGAQFWLRPLRLTDIPMISRWYEEVEDLAMFHQRMPIPLSADAVETAWHDAIIASEPRQSYWFVIDDEDNNPVGFGGIESINYVHGNALAPFFIARTARRRGLAVRSSSDEPAHGFACPSVPHGLAAQSVHGQSG